MPVRDMTLHAKQILPLGKLNKSFGKNKHIYIYIYIYIYQTYSVIEPMILSLPDIYTSTAAIHQWQNCMVVHLPGRLSIMGLIPS